MYLPRSQTVSQMFGVGKEVDVLLCQPPLSLRMKYRDQEPEVIRYFDAMNGNADPLNGDNPFEPNNGLLMLAGNLRAAGLTVQVLDFNIYDIRVRETSGEPISLDDIEQVIKRYRYRLLGISLMCISERYVKPFCEISRSHLPNAKVVFGGLLPRAVPQLLTERYPFVDKFISSAAELEIIELLKDTDGRRSVASRPADRAFDFVPADVPFIPRVVTASKQCRHACAFCSPVYDRIRNGDHEYGDTASEIERIRLSYGADFFLIGNLSLLSTEQDKFVCRRLGEWDHKISYWCQMRLEDVTPENVDILQRSGCIQVAVGIETENAITRRNVKHARTASNGVHELRLLKSAGISTYGYFIIGCPGDTRADALRTIGLIDSLLADGLLDATHLSVPVAYPGTPWFESPERFGLRIKHHNFSDYWMNCDPLGYGMPMLDTDTLRAEAIYELWKTALVVTADRVAGQFSDHRRLFNRLTRIAA